jgi:hypothetical protein
MVWNNRSKPSSSWEERESIGSIRVTEGGDFRLTEDSIFRRVSESISWAIRSAVTAVWTNRVKP